MWFQVEASRKVGFSLADRKKSWDNYVDKHLKLNCKHNYPSCRPTNMLHVDRNKSIVNTIMLDVDIIYLAWWVEVCHPTNAFHTLFKYLIKIISTFLWNLTIFLSYDHRNSTCNCYCPKFGKNKFHYNK